MIQRMDLAILTVAIAVSCPARADAAPFAYVPNSQDRTVSVIDAGTNSVVQTIPAVAVDALLGIGIDPTGTTAYIGSFSGQVLLYDLPTRAFVDSISAGRAPREIAFARNSAFAYVTDQDLDAVLKLDTATRQVVGSPIPVGAGPTEIKITNGGFAYVVNNQSGFVSVINLATDEV